MLHHLIAVLLLAASPAVDSKLRQFRAEAESAASLNAWDAVVDICKAWELAEPRNKIPPLCVAQALNTLGRHSEVVAPARRSLAIEESAAPHFYIGFAASQFDQLEEARRELARAVELDPKDPNARRVLGQSLADLGRYAEALVQAEAEKRLAPSNFGAEDRLAFWRLAAVWTFPREAIVLHGRAGWLMKHDRYIEAATVLRQALALAPKFADCHYHLGWCLQKTGDLAAAEGEYRAAIVAYPKAEASLESAAWYNLSVVLVRRGAAQEAVNAIRAAIRLNGNRAYYLYALGDACSQAGDRACAVDAWKRFLMSHEQLPEEARSDVRRRLSDVDEPFPGNELRMPVPAGTPAEALTRCEHGIELIEQGRVRDAILEVEAGLQLAPGFHKCRADLGMFYVMTSQDGLAEKELRAARTGSFSETDHIWRGGAAYALAHVLAARPGDGKEGRALLAEVASSGYSFDPVGFEYLRGTFCDQAGETNCTIEAYRRALASSAGLGAVQRDRMTARLKVLEAPKP